MLQLQILQRIRTLATDILTLFSAGIVLLSFASSHAQSAPRIDFQAPISSNECRERLRSFGASDAGIELAMPAIDAYIKLVLQAPTGSTTIALALLPSPLELSEATELQNHFEHQLAQCDAADTQLTSGINCAMRSDRDQQAAQRFQSWVNLRRDKLFLIAAQIDTRPLDFSVENAFAKIDKDGAILVSLHSQFAAHDAEVARLSRTARNVLLGTPIRTARLAKERSIATSINRAELIDTVKPAESGLASAAEDPAENLQTIYSEFKNWEKKIQQVRADGIHSASEAFEKIGETQRSFVGEIVSHANAEDAWDIWMTFYYRAYPQVEWDRGSAEASAKMLRKVSGATAESLAALSTFEKQWRTESLTFLAAAAKRYDGNCWIRYSKGIELVVPAENELRKNLMTSTDSFRKQIALLAKQNQTNVKPESAAAIDMSPESIRMEMEMTFGTLCSVSAIDKSEIKNILDATEATADQRALALMVQRDLSEAFIRSTDDVSNRWIEVGIHVASTSENQIATISDADFQEIARIRQEQLRSDRINSDQFFSQLSAILSTAPKGSLLETYRLIHLRSIERNMIKCLLEQIPGVSIEPLWRVDFETIVRATHVAESQAQIEDSVAAIIQTNNQALLPPMRRLSDALIALLATNQMMFASKLMNPSTPNDLGVRSIEKDADNPRDISDLEVHSNQMAAELARCVDESKQITSLQNASLAQILSTLPPKDARSFQDVFRRTAYPSLAKFLGIGDLWIIRALEISERDESNNPPAKENMTQSIIELASAYGPASEALFLTAVEQQSVVDATDTRDQPAKEILRRTLFARQELDAALRRDLERVLGPDLTVKLNQKTGEKNK
ncbi:MAG: hypothetical protein NTY97_06415 [Planctomycetota bacterium]|nr:hypothetical protein [Planctomycetota bacterium]